MTVYGRRITDDDMQNIASYMDDEIREELHSALAPCTAEEFISAYLERDPDFIDILEREFSFENNTTAWYIVDDCTTSAAFVDCERLDAVTQEEAVAIARDRFDRLSTHDKNRRDSFYVGLADCEKEEDVDFFDTMKEVFRIK